MTNITGIGGSLRSQSFNSMLLKAAAELAPSGVTIDVASIRGIPLYDGDLESESVVPEAVTVLKNRIAAADGLLLVTPEYNNSIPGVFKNAIDWLSRPASDIRRVFGGRPVALMGATPGRGGTVLAQEAWRPVLRALGTRPWFGSSVMVSGAHKVFDPGGRLIDDATRAQVRQFVAGFAEFIAQVRATAATKVSGGA